MCSKLRSGDMLHHADRLCWPNKRGAKYQQVSISFISKLRQWKNGPCFGSIKNGHDWAKVFGSIKIVEIAQLSALKPKTTCRITGLAQSFKRGLTCRFGSETWFSIFLDLNWQVYSGVNVVSRINPVFGSGLNLIRLCFSYSYRHKALVMSIRQKRNGPGYCRRKAR